MVITRFSSGYFGGTIYSVLNIFTQCGYSHLYAPFSLTTYRLGFATTTVIFGGQALASVNPSTLPLVVGIIIIGVCSLIPCIIGYNMVHMYERYAWMVTLICMLFLCGLGAKVGYDVDVQKSLEDTGSALPADILGFGGIVFGSFTGVGSNASPFTSSIELRCKRLSGRLLQRTITASCQPIYHPCAYSCSRSSACSSLYASSRSSALPS